MKKLDAEIVRILCEKKVQYKIMKKECKNIPLWAKLTQVAASKPKK